MRLVWKQLHCGCLRWLVFYFVCCRSLFQVQFELRQDGCRESCSRVTALSQLELQLTDNVACRHSVVSTGESERKTQAADQLVPMSPVVKRHNIDRRIRTESTERVTDWVNRAGVIGFLTVLNTEAWWENKEISRYSQTTSLTNSCLWVVWFFSQTEQKSLLVFTPKLKTAALI